MDITNLTLDNLDKITEDYQERMCKLCETHIIEGRSNTYHYQCEGSHCKQAVDYLLEDLEEIDIMSSLIKQEIGI